MIDSRHQVNDPTACHSHVQILYAYTQDESVTSWWRLHFRPRKKKKNLSTVITWDWVCFLIKFFFLNLSSPPICFSWEIFRYQTLSYRWRRLLLCFTTSVMHGADSRHDETGPVLYQCVYVPVCVSLCANTGGRKWEKKGRQWVTAGETERWLDYPYNDWCGLFKTTRMEFMYSHWATNTTWLPSNYPVKEASAPTHTSFFFLFPIPLPPVKFCHSKCWSLICPVCISQKNPAANQNIRSFRVKVSQSVTWGIEGGSVHALLCSFIKNGSDSIGLKKTKSIT